MTAAEEQRRSFVAGNLGIDNPAITREMIDQQADKMAADTTNPKDLLGVKKVQLGLFPAAGTIYGALAMEDGAVKYGPYNWREKKVQMTIYLDAMERHIKALRDGQDLAPDSKKPHLAHIIACGGILADAIEGGFLIDDRPPKGPAADMIEKYTKKDAPKTTAPAFNEADKKSVDAQKCVPPLVVHGFKRVEPHVDRDEVFGDTKTYFGILPPEACERFSKVPGFEGQFYPRDGRVEPYYVEDYKAVDLDEVFGDRNNLEVIKGVDDMALGPIKVIRRQYTKPVPVSDFEEYYTQPVDAGARFTAKKPRRKTKWKSSRG